ncbi:GlxA family transcriptional regulator [Streptomyces sp. NPDC001139]
MNVGVIALPGCWDSGLTTLLDVLRAANAGRPRVDEALPEIRVHTVAATQAPVRTAGGLSMPVDLTWDHCLDFGIDLLVVPAVTASGPAGVIDALMREETQALRRALRAWAGQGRELAAACTGTVILAEAGVLDDHQATTSWWMADTFRRRYPKVRLDMSRMVVHDGGIVTAGTAFAHIDLAISLVTRISPQLAETTAAALLIDERPARSVGSALGYLADTDHLVRDFEAWTRHNLQRDISVAEAALALRTTRRTLERRIRNTLGTTPYAVIRALRLERARHLQRTTDLSLDRIAAQVGYRDAATLGRLLKTYPGPRRDDAPTRHR